MKTPFKSVDRALAKRGITPVDVSDERNMGHPIFVYFGTNGFCRDDGSHAITGDLAKDLLAQLALVTHCDCESCDA